MQRLLEIMKVSLGCTSVSMSPEVSKSKENLPLPLSRQKTLKNVNKPLKLHWKQFMTKTGVSPV